MKFITVAFWSAVFGEILGYIVSQLTGGTYSFVGAAVLAIIVGEIAIIAIPAISGSAASKAVIHKKKNRANYCAIFFIWLAKLLLIHLL